MGRTTNRLLWIVFSLVFLLASCSANDEQAQVETQPVTSTTVATPTPTTALTQEQRCLALAMYWEAKGEGKAGMQAVGQVVVNRVGHPGFPGTLCGVTQEGGEAPPCQFSWWCDGRSDTPVEPTPWAVAQKLAVDLPNKNLKDITQGAIFFHATRIKVPWKKQRTRTVVVGRHVFYK
jgi:spore germination cell wall hydrolase CwlJ-like protein